MFSVALQFFSVPSALSFSYSRSLHVGIEDAGLDAPRALDLHEDSIVARLRKSIWEANFWRNWAGGWVAATFI